MNLLAVLPLYPPYSMVGSWVSTGECLAHMASVGHEVTVVTSHADRSPYMRAGVRVLGSSASSTVLYEAADVVLSHLGDDQKGARLAARHRKPLVRMVHGLDGNENARLTAHGRPALVVFPSRAAALHVGHVGPQIVVPPPVDPARYRVTPMGDSATLVNLAAEKGGALFARLAHAMPHQPFLGVKGGYGDQIVPRSLNVAVLDHLPDIRVAYRRTGILLMPSITETWGRVGVEAAASGIPIVAHPSPGLREALGHAPLWVDRDDLGGWVDAIRRLGMPTTRRAAQERSTARSAALEPRLALEAFQSAVEALN